MEENVYNGSDEEVVERSVVLAVGLDVRRQAHPLPLTVVY